MSEQDVTAEIKTVGELFEERNLEIPKYQRPYKWEVEHVRQLLQDIERESNAKNHQYRIGTVILHKDETILNIVDGQQRLTTLTLLLHALKRLRDTSNSDNSFPLLKQSYISKESIDHIKENYLFIASYVEDKWRENREQYDEFIRHHCEFVIIKLHDIDEAFQLFDSQNARGKPLEPYDLLKAYHLREMANDIDEDRKLNYVKYWESAAAREEHEQARVTLRSLIGLHLFRIRRWSFGLEAGEFTKNQIDEFKGVSIGKHDYRYVRPLRGLDALSNSRQHQINEPIINGHWFFEYTLHYLDMSDRLFPERKDNAETSQKNKGEISICKELLAYSGWWRSGDSYVRSLFRAALLHYYDKFGAVNLDQAAVSIFRWAYSLRITYNAIRKQRIEKHALAIDGGDPTTDSGAFRLITISVHPGQFIEKLDKQTEKLKDQNRSEVNGVDQLITLFPKEWEKHK